MGMLEGLLLRYVPNSPSGYLGLKLSFSVIESIQMATSVVTFTGRVLEKMMMYIFLLLNPLNTSLDLLHLRINFLLLTTYAQYGLVMLASPDTGLLGQALDRIETLETLEIVAQVSLELPPNPWGLREIPETNTLPRILAFFKQEMTDLCSQKKHYHISISLETI